MSLANVINAKLSDYFAPSHIEVHNESHMHNVPAGSELHFKLIIVSEAFAGKSRLSRHRDINKVLAEELSSKIHALAIHAFTPAEWEKKQQTPATPKCRGGFKH